ncbi:MAG: pyridine nucleotide-disulfide oxidoreductase [Anaerolineae bacterium CG03_land_8_20_14_0_80_58_20]|nr:MAG: pyridine nucleotide-disulfide oxidoreductase [Anaerolineae bacterium CG03_land_8_20_14_0_80_58_20]
MKKYDIAVIGAGSGGLVAALTAQRRGAKVALIERYKIGGECTHFGCVPSKSLISSARLYQAMKKAEKHGLPKVDVSADLDFSKVMERVDQIVQGVYANEQPAHFEGLGIDVYIDSAGASFLNKNEIQIGGETIWADYTVISTGSSPRMAPHEGSETLDFLTNENFWDLRELPRSIVFLGGGVISVELGQSLARFGSSVTIIDRNPRILKAADEAVSVLAIETLQKEGIQILTNAEVAMCRQVEDGKINLSIVQNGQPKEMTAEHIFVALGRVPNTNGLGLEKANVTYSGKGIEVNDFLQTSTPNIYACGDVASPAKFTHMASYQAEICVENILNGNHVENDYSIVPWAIFMEPEIGHVGLSEAEARRKFGEVFVSQVNTNSVDRFITESETVGFLKIVMDKNDVILGADAIGVHAGEWIQFLTLAIKQKLTLQSLAETIFVYPTFSEIVKKAATRYLRTKQSS